METIREWESSRGSFRFHEFNFKFWIIPRNGVKTEEAVSVDEFFAWESVSPVMKDTKCVSIELKTVNFNRIGY